ncbi:hypothetical protein B0H63DRAFT_187843 [Podospora didyma]|uniref:C2H2-type domain-containing protein n=1 Tax=Podospora didyma TaxID=330526 RepID=A0AAE0NQH8_9PEZI|nr:hypothetical protein B0H63DRAFT_187843 [Podospora didyma]
MGPANLQKAPSETLLHHLPAHHVLICTQCRYAIQPLAVSRHLKEIHHIYRSHRQGLVDYAKGLHLVDPADAVLPLPHEAPIPLLPTENGLACARDDCTHLCVTVKRMKSHWASCHKDLVGNWSPQWRPVALQTFFRGNQLKYFIVTPQDTSPEFPTDFLSLKLEFPPDWTPDHVALFKHFTQTTYLGMSASPMSRQLWQAAIPRLAFSHTFLKDGILACSALHLAHLHPSHKQRYRIIAARHQALALPKFRELVAAPTDETCNAILAFSQLLIVHSFAAGEEDESLLLVKEDPNGGALESDGLPDWLRLIRGSCTILGHVWANMKSGLLKPLVEESYGVPVNRPPPSDNTVPENPTAVVAQAQLKQLVNLPILNEPNHEKRTAYFSALMLLSRAFRCASVAKESGAFSMWTVVQVWPSRVSLEYLELLLRAREPAALVLLAHYCVLLGPLASAWYMDGFQKRLLDRIYWQLDADWRRWLDWPYAEAGLMPPYRAGFVFPSV